MGIAVMVKHPNSQQNIVSELMTNPVVLFVHIPNAPHAQ